MSLAVDIIRQIIFAAPIEICPRKIDINGRSAAGSCGHPKSASVSKRVQDALTRADLSHALPIKTLIKKDSLRITSLEIDPKVQAMFLNQKRSCNRLTGHKDGRLFRFASQYFSVQRTIAE